jgi:hypothetical protein
VPPGAACSTFALQLESAASAHSTAADRRSLGAAEARMPTIVRLGLPRVKRIRSSLADLSHHVRRALRTKW